MLSPLSGSGGSVGDGWRGVGAGLFPPAFSNFRSLPLPLVLLQWKLGGLLFVASKHSLKFN